MKKANVKIDIYCLEHF